MPPAVVDAIQNHRAALLARETSAMQAQAHAWLQVEQAIQAQLDALALELAQNPGMATMGQLARSRRYLALMEQTRDELRKYEDYLEPRIRSGQADMITMALQHSQQALNAVATEAQIVVPFNRLPVEAVNSMVGLAGDGSPLRDVLNDAARVGPDAMAQELVNGIALGRNPIQVARRALRMGLGQSFTRMQTIARTEQLRAYRVTTQTAYENSNVVVGYRRLSARDDRTCPGCLMADGRAYPLDVTFESHVNCRCALIPVLRNVPPVQFQTGQEWFAEQPESTQRRILGAGRYDAWKDGRATLDDMVSVKRNSTWGDAIVPTLVRDLGRGRSGVPGLPGGGLPSVPARAVQALRDVSGLGIDDLRDLGEMERWANARYSNVRFDFEGAHVDTIRPTLQQFDKLAQQYPEVAKRLEYMGTYAGKGAPSAGFDNASTFAHASADGKHIGLNSHWYGSPERFKESIRTSFETGWLDANGNIEDVLTHEFGHQVEHWLLSVNGKAFSRYVAADGTGYVGDTVRIFNRKNSPTAALSQYATTTNSIKTTRYAEWVTDKVEGWAEGFAAINHKPKSQWTAYVKRLDTIIREVGDTSKWVNASDALYVSDLPYNSIERQKAQETISEIRKRLNL